MTAADGYLLTLLTATDDEQTRGVLTALRDPVRASRGGVLAVAGNLVLGGVSPVAAVTRRVGDGELIGPTICFGPLDAALAGALGRWLQGGGLTSGMPPRELHRLRLTPLALAASAASRN
jgi:hypothetical protein